MEQIDLEIQWYMAEKKVNEDILKKIRMNPAQIINPRDLKLIRVENNKLILLGSRYELDCTCEYELKEGRRVNESVINNAPKFWEMKNRKKKEEYDQRFKQFADANLEDLRVLTLPIGIYIESLELVNKRMGTGFTKVDTKTSLSYLVENGEFWLKAKALVLGANAIVDFSETEYNVFLGYYPNAEYKLRTKIQKCSIGVPVKIRTDVL